MHRQRVPTYAIHPNASLVPSNMQITSILALALPAAVLAQVRPPTFPCLIPPSPFPQTSSSPSNLPPPRTKPHISHTTPTPQSTTSATTTSTTTSAASATSTADLEALCESGNPVYADACPQCLDECEDSAYADQCFFSVFTVVNEIESDCEARGGSNCKSLAVSEVCGSS